ncbi:MAG: hypothetical protein EXR55_00225 [Dehalococcoidia bacterium]|nr:hypothetical protein [Dehalococcoidia bacterium]
MSQDGRPDLIYEKFPKGHYAIFTRNRPERLNSMGGNMTRLMNEAMQDFATDSNMSVGIITGVGRSYSSGADLRDAAEKGVRATEVERQFAAGEIDSVERGRLIAEIGPFVGSGGGLARYGRTQSSLADLNKPFIAAVNGIAVAGGCENAMDCDIRICTPESYFGLYEVKRGFMPGSGIYWAPRLMPMGEGLYMLLTGDNLTAQRAKEIGFVHEVVERDRLLPRAVEIAEMIGANAPLAIQGVKAMAQFWRQFGLGQQQQLAEWASKYINLSEDAKEGPRAFAEKRAPVWKGA